MLDLLLASWLYSRGNLLVVTTSCDLFLGEWTPPSNVFRSRAPDSFLAVTTHGSLQEPSVRPYQRVGATPLYRDPGPLLPGPFESIARGRRPGREDIQLIRGILKGRNRSAWMARRPVLPARVRPTPVKGSSSPLSVVPVAFSERSTPPGTPARRFRAVGSRGAVASGHLVRPSLSPLAPPRACTGDAVRASPCLLTPPPDADALAAAVAPDRAVAGAVRDRPWPEWF